MTPKRQIQPERLPEKLDALPGIEVVRELARKVPAHLVGGAVRDLLLGEDRADLDVVIEGDVRALADAPGVALAQHERFLTAKLKLDGHQIDIAQARTEEYPQPGALPEVAPASIDEDLARRDFTINAMAVSLSGDPTLIDPHGGLDDLRAGVLRVLHDRSFIDDPTRALRAARYAARFDLDLEPRTEELLKQADLSTVSGDRVMAELTRIAAEGDPGKAVGLARGWGLVETIDPEGPQRASTVARLASEPPWSGWVDRGAAVMLAIVPPLEQCSGLARAAPERPSEAARLARELTPEMLVLARAIGAEWLDRYAAEWRHVALEIDGGDLIEAGIPEGPQIGKGLDAALSAKLDGEISGREQELQMALAVARGEIPDD
jgi:tRNA nucleotidyltransferase (CCA-adding enzyme)